jgi:hypothetical protein
MRPPVASTLVSELGACLFRVASWIVLSQRTIYEITRTRSDKTLLT